MKFTLATLSALLLVLLLNCCKVSCTHFAYGTISWTYTSGYSYTFDFESAWRTDYGWDEGTPTTTTGQTGNKIAIGNVYFGTSLLGTSGPKWSAVVTVTSIQPNDWFIGTTATTITFSSLQTWYYYFYVCCRLSSIQMSNHDSNTYLTGSVTVTATTKSSINPSSPTVTTFPRSNFLLGTAYTYSVPAYSAQGNTLTYGYYTSSQSKYTGLTNNLGIPTPWSLNTATGVLTWTTPSCCAGYLYALQFTITDAATSSFIVLDEIFELVTQCTSSTPGCVLAPYFSPAVAGNIYYFYYGTSTSYSIRAVDDTSGQTVTEYSTPLPTGATFTQTSSTTVPSVATYALTWQPTLGQVGRSVCFTAFNTAGLESTGSNCATMQIASAYILIVACVIRDFGISGNSDFGTAVGTGDSGKLFVGSTLSGSGPPTFNSAVSTTTTSASTFPTWWQTSASLGATSWNMVLTSSTNTPNSVYTYSTSNGFFPIDGILGGNQGQTHNYFFTLEGHTYFAYNTSGVVLTFTSTDDLFVYVNGVLLPSWNLGGIPTSTTTRQYVANLDTIAASTPSVGLKYDDTAHDYQMRIDFFYAHRSGSTTPSIQMQLTQSYLCNAISSGKLIVDYTSGLTSTAASKWYLLGAAAFNSASLSLLSGSPYSSAGVAYYGSSTGPVAQTIVHGFEVDFSFKFTGASEGFALVFQSYATTAEGSEGGGLGYSNIPKSLAIEFDGIQSAEFGDQAAYTCGSGKCAAHVSIHTAYAAANSANEASTYSLGSFNGTDAATNTGSSLYGLYMNFSNSTLMHVRVQMIPPDSTSGATLGWVKVYMAADGYSESILPVAMGQIDVSAMATAWGGAAYVGFTAATSDTYHADIVITNFNLTVVQPSALYSAPQAAPGNIVAGTTGTFIVQLKDVCKNNLTTGGDLSSLTIGVTRGGSTVSSVASIVDNNDGTYTVSYFPTKAAAYYISVAYAGTGISGSPWSFQVIPARASPSMSSFNVSVSGTILTGSTVYVSTNTLAWVNITGIDAYGNLASTTFDSFSVVFAPTISNVTTPAPYDTIKGNGYYATSFSTGVSGPYSLYVTLNSQNLPNSALPVQITAGPAYAPQCTATGTALTQTTAGTTGTFSITLRDSAGNQILPSATGASSDHACESTSQGCYLTRLSAAPASPPAPTVTTPIITCAWASGPALPWTCTFFTYTAGTYSFNVIINGLQMTSLPTTALVIPAAVNASTSTLVVPSSVVAGTTVSSVYIQARDSYWNNRTTSNDANSLFASTYSPSSFLTGTSTVPYLGNGQYGLSFTSIVAGTLSISSTYTPSSGSASAIGNSPAKLLVVPASPDTPSTLNLANNAIFNATSSSLPASGQSSYNIFTVSSIDVYGNARNYTSNGPDASSFLVQLYTTGGQLLTSSVTTSLTWNTLNRYTAQIFYPVAGTYSLSVALASTAATITNAPRTITIIPGPTSTSNCYAYGAGTSGLTFGIPVSVFIVARDQYNNVETYGSAATADTFYILVDSQWTFNAVAYLNNPGVYNVSYSISSTQAATAGITSGSTFPLAVYRTVSGTGVLVETFNVQASNNAAIFYVSVTGTNNATGQLGVVNTFSVQEWANSAMTTPIDGSITLLVSIQYTGTGTCGGSTCSTIQPTITSQPATSNTYPATFTPSYFVLPTTGAWSVIVSRGSIYAQNQPAYAIVAGPVSKAAIISLSSSIAAGSSTTAVIQLQDQAGNVITSVASGSTVTAQFYNTSSQTMFFTTTGTYSSSTTYWSFPYTINIATTYQVYFYYNSGTTSTQLTNSLFSVVAGAPYAPSCTVSGDGVSAVYVVTLYAGGISSTGVSTYSPITLILRDKYGNLVDSVGTGNSYTSSLVITPTLTPSANLVQSSTYAGNSQSLIYLQSTVSGAATLSLALASSSGTSYGTLSGINIMVLASVFSSSKSSVQVQSPVKAGNSISAQMISYDTYGNPWTGSVAVSIRDPNGAVRSLVVSNTLTSTTSTYIVTASGGTATGTVGSNTFEFTVASSVVSLTGASTTLLTGYINGNVATVTPGDVYPPNTIVPGALAVTLVGTTQTFNITLVDLYGNIVTNPSATPTFSVSYWQNRINCANLGDIDGNGGGLTALNSTCTGIACPVIATVSAFAGTNGVYAMTFEPKVVGTFTLNITINNQALPCASIAQLSVVTTPGNPDPAQSYILGLPSSSTAAVKVPLTIYLRDSFGNAINYGGETLSLISVSGATYSVLNGTIVDSGTGLYTVTVNPSVAGTWGVGLVIPRINKAATLSCLSSPPSSLGVPSSACIFTITAAQAWLWNVIDNPIKARAGDPSNFTIQVTDAYGNPVTSSNLTLTVSGTSSYVTSYTIPGGLTDLSSLGKPGEYTYSFFSVWSGGAQFAISFSPQQSSYCVANSPNLPYLCPSGSCVKSAISCSTPPKSAAISLTIQHATCAYDTSSTPFRCADGSCVASATSCPENTATGVPSCSSTQYLSAVDNACHATSNPPACPTGLTACSTGVCVSSTSVCPVPLPCPSGYAACPTTSSGLSVTKGVCRLVKTDGTGAVNTTQCPSTVVCPLNRKLCPDQRTCVSVSSTCTDVFTLGTATCSTGQIMCWNGQCATSFENCPTQKTCPPIRPYLCPDGSCQSATTNCAAVMPCWNSTFTSATSVTCPDGTCRASIADCASLITCPVGYVLCESGQCASSLDNCPLINPSAHSNQLTSTATLCATSTVRCPDGSCRNNTYFCPTRKTCPTSLPLMCADGTCTTSIYLCTQPKLCTTTVTCPDGSCASSYSQCATITTCPFSTPVLCPDGSCLSSASKCATHNVDACPASLPLRCPDGSCRSSVLDCPSRAACIDPKKPVRCGDGHCAESLQVCPSGDSIACPAGTSYRCPYGGCSNSSVLCPTPITCPVGAVRCNDGSCRSSCDSTTELSTCPSSFPLLCPVPTGGSVCVTSYSQCPTFPMCPTSTPVRCLDATCAASISSCPALPTAAVSGHVPCPDGSWSTNPFTCPTPSFCPVAFPFKCWDDTCREGPNDCPLAPSCSNTATPYRCATGACGASPWDDARGCIASTTLSCSLSTVGPVRCPGTSNAGACVTDISQCFSTSTTDLSMQCPAGLYRCRDGSCRYGAASAVSTTSVTVPGICDDALVSCPTSLPYACTNGICVADSTTCPLSPALPTICPTGTIWCTGGGGCLTAAACTTLTVTARAKCTLATGLCSDGSCQSPCPSLVCADGTNPYLSVSSGSVPSTITSDATNPCISGLVGLSTGPNSFTFAATTTTSNEAGIPANTVIGGVCDAAHPYKCTGGFCAVTASLCPAYPTVTTCPSAQPFQCANGLCVVDASQCPVVRVCSSAETRCGDGSCRSSSQCMENTNTCPSTSLRCPNGLCSSTTDLSGCLCTDTTNSQCTLGATGCQPGYFRCSNDGSCMVIGTSCSSSATASGGESSTGVSTSISGCPATTPTKCPDGSCATSSATCTQANGCPAATPIRCTQAVTSTGTASNVCVASSSACTDATVTSYQCADGTYVSAASLCTALNGCPLTAPYRCADGSCKLFPATAYGQAGVSSSQVCPAVVTCASPLVICADGSCQAAAAYCPSLPGCATSTPTRCFDGSCATSASACPVQQCPTASPVLCADGACVPTIQYCPNYGSAGSSTGGAAGSIETITGSVTSGTTSTSSSSSTSSASTGSASPVSVSRCASPLLECFDGSCRASTAACLAWGNSTRSTSTGTCESQGYVTCADGSCMPNPALCPIIAACPSTIPVRCGDGTCVAGTSNAACSSSTFKCSWPTGVTPSTTWRCEDGTCRAQCLRFDGCPVWKPYHCTNRECATDASSCSTAVVGSGFVYDSTLVTPRYSNGNTPASVFSTSSQKVFKLFRRLLALSSSNEQDKSNSLLNDFAELATGTTDTPTTASPTTASPTSSSSSSSTTSVCYTNCRSQIKATTASYSVTVGEATTIAIAADSASVLGRLSIPSAALSTGGNVSTVTVSITSVDEGTVRRSENRIFSAKWATFGAEYFTFAESVLSPMFNLTLDSRLVQPVPVNMTAYLAVDRTLGEVNTDICLAKLIMINPPYYSGGFSAWQCVATATYQTGSTDPTYMLNGPVTGSGIYAMIYVPAYSPNPPPGLSWVLENIGYLILILVGGIAFIFVVLYAIGRLTRYRKKYHEERDAVKKQQEEVDEMEQFGGSAGTKDDEVEMQTNPLVVQMKDMQARLDKKNDEMRKVEIEQRQQESAARSEHINALKNDRDTMLAELERLKAELALQAKQKPAGPRHEGMTVPSAMTSTSSSYATTSTYNSAPTPQYGQPVTMTASQYDMGTAVPPQQRQEFNSARPKARRGVE